MDGGSRQSSDELWIIIAALAAPPLAWWAWSAHFVTWLFELKLAELRALAALGFDTAYSAELAAALRGALAAPEKIDFDTFRFALDAVGFYLRWPVAAALSGLGAWLLFFHPAVRFRRRFDLGALAEAMRERWPYALHALRRGNLKIPLDDPVWGMALSGDAFLRRHDLLEKTDGGWRLRERRAEAVLALQLGPPWPAAPAHARALAGLFALRVAAFEAPSEAASEPLKRRAFDGLRRLALAAADNGTGGYLPTGASYAAAIAESAAVLRSEAIRRRIAGHAYTQTVLLRLLAEARQGGALPAALFNWLKGVDRPLWYALSSLGRRLAFAEALGAMSHFEAERRAGGALYSPALSAAVEGLQPVAAGVRPRGAPL